MNLSIPFDNTYATLPGIFYTKLNPTPVKSPRMIAWNDALADTLGISNQSAEVYAGNTVPAGAAPLAQLYAGHQFGNYNPQLGDGRAILLGEVIDKQGKRRDIQLKGSGPTPYSRMGDGRAWLGPVLREYVVSEAMNALGIPTTRALAATSTGESVYREQGALPGAVLTRVADSHLRVGTFQIFAHQGEREALQILTDYAIARHHPNADGPMGLLAAVCAAQAELVAAWMSVGFIHGVMNTDNCAISGETIDYGPCAFMDAYAEGQVFSSIDRTGRYAYGNQPRIAVWNMAQLATALIQLSDDTETAIETATAIVHAMPQQLQDARLRRFGAKIGLNHTPTAGDHDLIEELLALMQADGADFTNTFATLGTDKARDQFTNRNAFDDWVTKWQTHTGPDADAIMARANPQIIPRNHQIEAMINAAVAGDMKPFDRLITAQASPYDLSPEYDDLRRPPLQSQIVSATFCGT